MTGAITTNSTFDGRDVATDGTKLDTVATNANNYSHPANHAISVITGLQTALDAKASTTSVNNLSTVYDPIGTSVAMAIALGG
jgi:flagellin-specific chaperone FliS